MFRELRRAVLFTMATMILFGGAYHALLWAIGALAFSGNAEGSLVRRADGTIAGSRLIAQAFTKDEYFHPRPSGVDYNAASTGGTNYGPSNPDHLAAVRERLDAVVERENTTPDRVPSELVTASGAGLDPHISPAAAELQIARIAAARGATPDRVRELVEASTEGPTAGVLGRPRVNVLLLNLSLDRELPVAQNEPGEPEE